MDLDAQYYHTHSQEQYLRAREFLTLDYFNKNDSILDVGCGDGKITAEVASLVPNGRVLGIDASQNMISHARESFKLPNLEFQCRKAEDISITELFDIILCFNCFLWIRQPKLALQRFSKAIKPGGKLLILTYLKESSYVEFLEKTLEQFPLYQKLSAVHTMLSLDDHRKLLESNGFQVQTFEVRDLVSCYSTKEELRDYLRGWIRSYVPIPEPQVKHFLDKAIENSLSFSIHNDSSLIKLPYRSLIIKATKQLG